MKVCLLVLCLSVFSFSARADVSSEVASSSQDETVSPAARTAGADIRCEEAKRNWRLGIPPQGIPIDKYKYMIQFLCGEIKSGVGVVIDKQAFVKNKKSVRAARTPKRK